ncbi:MAG: chlorite dismutase family protein [Rhodopseudomonas sp.]|uniref:chlorite dismutase family protein n=1 Tax=Rhodopseudomonas sp. TaxID=1078 RepID=UPI0017E35B4F|nr:chlorite dismutase family protein [Rhodopseudomonas sp.]NVN84989.1 chlorite dismutase family protein [Rhodopseudomonas sp.]
MFTIFRGGDDGVWRVTMQAPVSGAALPPVRYLAIEQATDLACSVGPSESSWQLTGVASHVRYVERNEKIQLGARQAGLGRSGATCAALIPIQKSAAWWELTQDERRQIFEDKSHHIAGSLKYLPAIARQLYHCRDLGEPFDFLTWFEYAPTDATLFEDLVGELRRTAEWAYVTREIDFRLAAHR